jgi:hypothetical protein
VAAMTPDQLQSFLIWCAAIHYCILLVWFAVFVLAHDWLYRMHSRWFRLSMESFDLVNYAGVALYKIGIMLFVLVPLIALIAGQR